jgi:hypothetical protein
LIEFAVRIIRGSEAPLDECDQLCRIIGASIQTARREIDN